MGSRYEVVDHKGKVFPNTYSMALHWGIPPSALYGRLNSGWELEKALTTPTYKGLNVSERFVNVYLPQLDETFRFIDLCERYSIHRSTLRFLYHQFSPEEVEYAFQQGCPLTQHMFSVLGVWYRNKDEFCKANNITSHGSLARIEARGFSREDVVLAKQQGVKLTARSFKVGGTYFRSMLDYVSFVDIPQTTVYGWYELCDKDPERLHEKVKQHYFKNKEFYDILSGV